MIMAFPMVASRCAAGADGATAELLREGFGEVITSARRQAVATGLILDPPGLVVTAALMACETGECS